MALLEYRVDSAPELEETKNLSRAELIFESQTTDNLVDELLEAGLLAEHEGGGFTLADVGRIRVIEELIDRGIPVAELARASREGAVSFSWFEGLLPPPPHRRKQSYRELFEQVSIPIELATTLFEVWGVAMPDLDTRVREDDARLFEYIGAFLGFVGAESKYLVVESTRSLGDNARRNAQAELEFFRRRFVEPLLAAGASLKDVVETLNPLVANIIRPGLQELLNWLNRRHLDANNMQMLVQVVENALEATGVEVPRPTNPPAIVFVDMSGYTPQTDVRGDESAAEVATQFSEIVRGLVTRNGGTVVKFLGDGVMLHFTDPDDAIRSARALIAALADAGLPAVHAGIDAGKVVLRDGDYFGRTVNIAARIAEYARPGEVLVSDAAVGALSKSVGTGLRVVGPTLLKGLAEPVQLHALTPLTSS